MFSRIREAIAVVRSVRKKENTHPDSPAELQERVEQAERQLTYLETQVKLLERVHS